MLRRSCKVSAEHVTPTLCLDQRVLLHIWQSPCWYFSPYLRFLNVSRLATEIDVGYHGSFMLASASGCDFEDQDHKNGVSASRGVWDVVRPPIRETFDPWNDTIEHPSKHSAYLIRREVLEVNPLSTRLRCASLRMVRQ